MKTLLIARRELFLIVECFSFFVFLRVLSQTRTMHGAVLQYFFGGTILLCVCVMFLATVITARLVAGERGSGALEPLLTGAVPHVRGLRADWRARRGCAHDVRHRVAAAVVAAGELREMRELRSAAAGLERVFATLTGRAT